METPEVKAEKQTMDVEETKVAADVEVKNGERPVENVEVLPAEDAKTEKTVEEKVEEKAEEKVSEPATENGVAEKKENGKTKEAEPTEKLLKRVKSQLEFYFGNVNLNKDRFLIEQTKLDEGWVPLSVLLTFKMLASMTKDFDVILKAIEDSELIEVSTDKKKIRRSPSKPLPKYDDEFKKAQEARTLYLKGFPKNFDIEKMKNYLEENNLGDAEIENIVMRKYKKGKEFFFKGSIFLQFTSLDAAKEYMNRESIKFGDTDLIKMWSSEYTASKAVEKEERKQKKGAKGDSKNDNNKKQKDSDKKEETKEEESPFPKGSVIHMTGIADNITREDFKQCISELEGEVAFVDYKKGDPTGWVRLQGENAAQPILDKLENNKLKVKDSEIECRLLTGKDEEEYLNKIRKDIANSRRRKGGRGGPRGRGQKRRHSPFRESNKRSAMG